MPLYDYKCPQHGLFHDLATMAQSHEPNACPKCGTLSPRVIMIPPEVLAMAPAKRKAMDNNERAKHQPIISTADSRQEAAEIKRFEEKKGIILSKSKCGCHQHEHANQSALKQQVVLLPDGSKVFPSQRPWMISH